MATLSGQFGVSQTVCPSPRSFVQLAAGDGNPFGYKTSAGIKPMMTKHVRPGPFAHLQ